jgi:hypothetical protein
MGQPLFFIKYMGRFVSHGTQSWVVARQIDEIFSSSSLQRQRSTIRWDADFFLPSFIQIPTQTFHLGKKAPLP